MAEPGEHVAEVSHAERYVATLFLQCRQIANFFEESEADKAQRPRPPVPAQPPRKQSDEEDLLLAGVDSDGSELSVGSAGSLQRRRRDPVQPSRAAHLTWPSPQRPPGPKPRARPQSAGASFRPGPWTDTHFSEASRLERIQGLKHSQTLPPSKRLLRQPARERQQRKDKRRVVRRASQCSIASIFSATSHGIPRRERRSSVWSLRSADGDFPPEKAVGHQESKLSTQDSLSATTARTGMRSIFALPDEEDDENGTKRRNGLRGRRRLTATLQRSSGYLSSKTRSDLDMTPRGRAARGRIRAPKSAQQVNRQMEESFLRRFRTTKEDESTALTTAIPQTSETVMTLHQLATSVNVSFDDARLIKAAFDAHDAGKGQLEYMEFVQAVLHLHRTMNSTCSASTLSQCEALCAVTFPGGGLDGTVDLLKLLQWYSTYSFQEELILSADMRDLRRLSRQYGVPWEEVDNVKRQFDAVDEDGSGDISLQEFSDVLRRVLQVPPNLELPANRVRYFWQELDHDGNGKADFTEFLPWWLKYFHNKEGRKMLVKPFEDFYRNVRSLKNPDPPPYRQGEKIVTTSAGTQPTQPTPQHLRRESSIYSQGASIASGGPAREGSILSW